MDSQKILNQIEEANPNAVLNLNNGTAELLPSDDSAIVYNPLLEGSIEEAQRNSSAIEVDINTEKLPIHIHIKDTYKLSPKAFALSRRNGFGASDSSVLLGVNPYNKLDELIKQKATTELSEEEQKIGRLVSVRKGNDLEPLIIMKASKVLGKMILKPPSMYKFTDIPYLNINFDGVINTPEQYIPCEIKLCTQYGEKHYNFNKAIYNEDKGFNAPPTDVSNTIDSIIQKAAHYGVPPYYYTQCQQEMMGLQAPFGYLAVLSDKNWLLHIFMIYRDKAVQQQLIVQGGKAWNQVEQLRTSKGLSDSSFLVPSVTDTKTKSLKINESQTSSEDY